MQLPAKQQTIGIGLTIQLDRIMTGELDEIVDALLLADQANNRVKRLIRRIWRVNNEDLLFR